jgi:transposase
MTVFEVGIADRQWHLVERRRLNRRQFARFLAEQPASHVVMEACGTAHYWGRVAQGHGHRVTLLPVRYVKPYLRGNKTDRTDVDALLDAVRTGHIAPVWVKTAAQQEIVALHRIREQWMATRTARINALRGFFREHGLALPAGPRAALVAVPALAEQLPRQLALAVTSVFDDVRAVEQRIVTIERQLGAIAKDDATVQRLLEIPGIGLLTATALVGSVGRITAFRRARQFASWLGLTPREHSSGPRRRLGSITKRGDVYLRCLLTHGARAVLLTAQRQAAARKPLTGLQPWAVELAARKGHNKTTIAVANKLARIVWAVWARDTAYTATPAAA